ncbi:unnamed protein product [Paramecium octaurelia]|uniref:Uncharacterized protein n=1 Tax=Paramecium octaurelia TaxID=43137 RepID=A0A8S1TVZ6_PAROT|nr:unnamed protein product [Paramecium octaurelia]
MMAYIAEIMSHLSTHKFLLCNSIAFSFFHSTYTCLLLYEYNQIRPSYNVSECNKR